MSYYLAHSGMLIMILALASLALGSGPGVAANGGKINRKQAQRSVFPAVGGVLTLKEICPA